MYGEPNSMCFGTDRRHAMLGVGPFTGSIIAVAFYKFIKLLEYEVRSRIERLWTFIMEVWANICVVSTRW